MGDQIGGPDFAVEVINTFSPYDYEYKVLDYEHRQSEQNQFGFKIDLCS